MTDRGESQDQRGKRQRHFEEEVPSSKILKLALLAAAIIVILALILYWKARHAPPALRDQRNVGRAQLYARCDISRAASCPQILELETWP